MKNIVKFVLAGMVLSLSLVSCTPKTETVTSDAADSLKVDSTQVVGVDTTQSVSEDSTATK